MSLDLYFPTIPTPTSYTGGASTRIPFVSAGLSLTDSDALKWNDTLKKLTITATVT